VIWRRMFNGKNTTFHRGKLLSLENGDGNKTKGGSHITGGERGRGGGDGATFGKKAVKKSGGQMHRRARGAAEEGRTEKQGKEKKKSGFFETRSRT